MTSREAGIQPVLKALDPEVWLVTSAADHERGGLICTSVMNASIVPDMPRIIVGLAMQHRTWQLVDTSGRLVLHLLRADQIELVRTFGMQTQRDVDKFAGLDVGRSPEGCPLLRDVAGWLECRVESRLDAGDRTHFLAEIVGGSPPGHDIEILRMQGLLASASDEMKAELKRQLDHDAGIDRQAISAWRAAHRTG
ncbi:flavin reductase family protein [Maioricimonas sp. JC845]|uniref:flavin reductase family protein n=1 Tax=Maioricimonas sp. JC845 TaxID=3232138 RepID=UPI00345B1204